ncbi:MAG: DUF305 domain-containing protein [Caulobacter sp.]|nr:DUF305 domain-containing protein [Caulobacter sp.]
MKRISLVIAVCAGVAACSPESATQTPTPAKGGGMSADHSMGAGTMGPDAMGMSAPAAGDSEATRGYKAAMVGMMQGVPAYVGNPDIDFMTQMRGHHVAAIAMARVELAQGQNAKARSLAQEIITAQEREIAVIDAWLAANPD